MHINVYKDKNILPLRVWSSSKYLEHKTVLIHSSHISANKQNSNSWHCDNIVLLKGCGCLMYIWEGTALWIEIVYVKNITMFEFS